MGLMIYPDSLDNPEFREAWETWIADRRERGLPRYTARAQHMQLSRLASMGSAAAIAAIEWSIAQGYKGIFPPPVQTAAQRPDKDKAPSTWALRTQLDAVDQRLKQLRSKLPGEHCALVDFLSQAELQEFDQLSKKRTHIQNQLIHA